MLRTVRWWLCVFAILAGGCAHVPGNSNVLFQHSTLPALLQANYAGDLSLADLKTHGDFGLGTFDALDGEMLAWQGIFYQIKSDGRAYRATPDQKTPFAAVCFFAPEIRAKLSALPDLPAVIKAVDALLPTNNVFYALAVEGEFAYIKVRSMPRQKPPYPLMVEVVKSQPVYELKNVRGVMLGFRCPAYAQGLNVPGYHWHFITQDQKQGGHVLECRVSEAQVAIAVLQAVNLELPRTADFYRLDLSQNQAGAVQKVEK